MATEARRGFVRILSNYTRLFLSVLLGLLLVRLLLRGVGEEAFGLIALMGSTVGLAAMFQDIVRSAMIRELGAAYHSEDPAAFALAYNAAVAVSAGAALLAAAIFAALALLLPFIFRIPDPLVDAARWFMLAKGVETCFTVLLAPQFNMYLVSERMFASNLWVTAERAAYVLAAVAMLFLLDGRSPAWGVIAFGWIGAALVVLVLVTASALIMPLEPRLVFRPSLISREAVRSILGLGGWNVMVTTANNLHIRLGAFIMNWAFGVMGNLVFGLAVQLTSYVRMVAAGMTLGLDAVAARLSSSPGDTGVRSLLYHSTRLHGFVTFPAAVAVWLLAEPLLVLWVGPRLEDPANIPLIAMLIRILMVGIAVRSITDGWIRILYGAGHVRRYAPLILAGGVANPVLAGILLMVLPEPIRYTAVAWAFSIVLIVVHLAALPLLTARLLETTATQMIAPLIKPLLLALACTPILWLTGDWVRESTLALIGAVAGYGLVYVTLSLFVLMDFHERRRFSRAALRRLGVKQASA